MTSDNDDDEGKSVAARITYAPFFQSDRVLHFGASGAWREPPQNAPADPTMPCSADNSCAETVRFRSKPESNPINDSITGGRLVDTGNIPGDVQYFSLRSAPSSPASTGRSRSRANTFARTWTAASATAWCSTATMVI